MAAVLGLDDGDVRAVCEAASGDGVVEAANYNAPGQVVIAGQSDALAKAIEACKEAGARRAMPLAVSAPFHSSLMKPAAEKMAEALAAASFSAPAIPVVQNVDATFCDDPGQIRENLVRQMYSAVLWTDCVGTIKGAGIETLVECGPGKVLAGLAKRIDRGMTAHNIGDSAQVADVAGALGA